VRRGPRAAALLLLAAAAGSAAPPARAAEKAPVVLFVCEHGAGRSPVAAAWFDRLAAERGLPHRAAFRGTTPSASLSAAASAGLSADGFLVDDWKPKAVSDDDLRAADAVVVMGCPLPGRDAVAEKVRDWDGMPGPGEGYEASRDAIRTRVEKLVEELAAPKAP
jgi:protein-tyrosine-phosphatase